MEITDLSRFSSKLEDDDLVAFTIWDRDPYLRFELFLKLGENYYSSEHISYTSYYYPKINLDEPIFLTKMRDHYIGLYKLSDRVRSLKECRGQIEQEIKRVQDHNQKQR